MSLSPGAQLRTPWRPDFSAMVYVLSGEGAVGTKGRPVQTGHLAVLGAGDAITVKDKPQSRRLAAKHIELTQITPVPDWLTVDKEQFSGKVSRIPTRDEIAPIVNEQLIVELYSR